MDPRTALADVARVGPYFTIRTGPAEAADPTWRPLADLWTDPVPLRDRIDHVRRALGGERRVAASIAFQGLAAGLVSPPYATAVAHGVVPALDGAGLHWRAAASGPWPLWWAGPGARPGGATTADGPAAVPAHALAAALAAGLEPLLAALVAAVRAQEAVSARILWGGVASSVAGAGRLLAADRPALAGRAAAVAGAWLATGALAGTGRWLPPRPPDRVATFRRASCCLYYRVPGGGLCGDCVLHDRQER